MNSASAILTNNSDRYFIPFKPDGSKSMHFRLSFEPGSFESAFKKYNEWQEILVQNDWPYCFGLKGKKVRVENVVKELDIMQTYPTEFDEFMANRKKERYLLQQKVAKDNCIIEKGDKNDDIPNKWQDIISLKKSTASANDNYYYYNNNNYYGLFASRNLPTNTPLGYYFGVPMTEDEFDSMKDGIGQASDYSYMYQQTVIDPTDKNGRIYYYDGAPLCPFHYIKETSIREKVNVVFYEGDTVNQIICWTKKDILPGDELFSYYHSYNDLMPSPPPTTTSVSSLTSTTQLSAPVHSPESTSSPTDLPTDLPAHLTHLPPILSRKQDSSVTSKNNGEYWQKKPSISSMLNTIIPIV